MAPPGTDLHSKVRVIPLGHPHDQKHAPLEQYAQLTGEAWEAFGEDPSYGVEIAQAAVKLLAAEGITPGGILVGDSDTGQGSEPGPAQGRPR